jgi:hypothetical protein
MGLRAGKKTTVTVNVGISATPVAMIGDVMGAKEILIKAYNGPNGNVCVVTAEPSFDGVNVATTAVGSGVQVGPSGGAATNTAGGSRHFVQDSKFSSGHISNSHITMPFIRIYAAMGSGGGNVTFDIIPIFDVEDPQMPLGKNPFV